MKRFALLLLWSCLGSLPAQAPAPAPLAPASAPAPTPAVRAALLAVVDRCFGSGADRDAAATELVAAIERDYAAAFAIWENEPDGRRRTCLEHALQLPAVRAAATIVAGAVERTETVQGGVVDYHDLLAHFAAPAILRATDDHRQTLAQGFLRLLRGSSWDWWLADRLAGEFDRARAVGPRVWLFVPEEYVHRRPQQRERVMVLLQWQSLPIAAAPCIARLRS